MKQYEAKIHIVKTVMVEAENEQEARKTALHEYVAMEGIPAAAVKKVDVMEIAQPTAIFGSRGRGVIF